jgi:hypothetical protein
MPHRVSLSRQAADGARRVAELERQLEQLEYDNRFRRFKYRLLTASHSFLLWQQEQLIVEAGGEATLASCYAGRTAEDLLPITHLQSDLNIEQIGDNPTGSRSSWTTLQSVQSAILIDPARPLAPSDDSLWMVREVCSCPPHPGALAGCAVSCPSKLSCKQPCRDGRIIVQLRQLGWHLHACFTTYELSACHQPSA